MKKGIIWVKHKKSKEVLALDIQEVERGIFMDSLSLPHQIPLR